jgi:AraC-like DNA-binding protein
MEEAAMLLESSDEGIAEVAERVGYDTASAFSKLFTRHYGLSPSTYRARNQPETSSRRRSG